MIVHGEFLRTWVEQRIGCDLTDHAFFIGTMKGDAITGAVALDRYTGTDVEVHFAGSPGWGGIGFALVVFGMIFNGLGCPRCTGHIDAGNVRALSIAERLGFKREGVMRCAARSGADLIVLGMLKQECRFYGRRWKSTKTD